MNGVSFDSDRKGAAMRRIVWAVVLALLLVSAAGAAGCDGEEDQASDLPPQEGLEVGDVAPDFRMKNQEQATIALSDYRGVKNVILVFYPLAFTPV
jgi:cytochrome oxidase Cu insertion factor (SCO1/SenC/PrrC family)